MLLKPLLLNLRHTGMFQKTLHAFVIIILLNITHLAMIDLTGPCS
jgi:hypothetical protein